MTARGKWGTLLAAALLGVFVAIPIAYAHDWAYADSFPEQSYNNNTGSLEWDGPWQEIGESDGPGSGAVSVQLSSGCNPKCLVLNPVLETVTGASRSADLGEAESVELWYVVKIEGGLVPAGSLEVQMKKAGSSWKTVKSHPLLLASQGFKEFTVPVNQYAGYESKLQFLLIGVNPDAKISIKEVELGIEYSEEPTSTTTTTSTSTTTTTKPAPTTTTTTKPTSTTSTTSSTTSTTVPRSTSSTTTTTLPETTTTARGDTDSDDQSVPPSGQTQPPSDSGALATGSGGSLATDIATARAFGISLNMSPVGSAPYDRLLGLNPLTSLTASFRSVVEAIQSEYLSALGLAFLVAFFAVRIPGNDEEETPRSDGSIGQ